MTTKEAIEVLGEICSLYISTGCSQGRVEALELAIKALKKEADGRAVCQEDTCEWHERAESFEGSFNACLRELGEIEEALQAVDKERRQWKTFALADAEKKSHYWHDRYVEMEKELAIKCDGCPTRKTCDDCGMGYVLESEELKAQIAAEREKVEKLNSILLAAKYQCEQLSPTIRRILDEMPIISIESTEYPLRKALEDVADEIDELWPDPEPAPEPKMWNWAIKELEADLMVMDDRIVVRRTRLGAKPGEGLEYHSRGSVSPKAWTRWWPIMEDFTVAKWLPYEEEK
jgi:hypothetical protein